MTSVSPLSDPLPSPSTQRPPAAAAAAAAPVKPKSKPRKRVNTAEKRHQHNAIERARRETLNSKFLSLARLLPSLANHRRPSKSAIVNGSISHISKQREQRLLAASLLKQLTRERDELFEEINEWRKASGVAPKDGPVNAWNDDMDAVCSVEQEVFGNFASMDGDDDGEDEPESDMMSESNHMMPQFAVPSVNGLITPRSSTDVDPMNHPAMFQRPPQTHVQQSVQPHPPTVNMHGVNWSQEFANQFQHPPSASNPTPSMSNNTPLPFSAFMSDSTDSPGTSNLGNSIMLTPPTTADPMNVTANGIYTHTPSPRPSNASVEDKVPSSNGNVQPPPPQTQQWTPQQLLFLQQIQQHQAQIRQHQQSLANHYSAFPGNALNASNNAVPSANPIEGFTQSLIATMFPQQAHVNTPIPDMGMGMGMNHLVNGAGLEQVQQWRKAALTSFLQQQQQNGAGHGNPPPPQFRTTSPYQAPLLTPGGLGIGMNGHGWSPENAVEGF